MFDNHSLSSFSGIKVNNGGTRKANTEKCVEGHDRIIGLKTEFISDLQAAFGRVCASANKD
jgi:hypothetical protein